VDGWLSRLVANELGIETQEILDRGARELVLPGRRDRLTRLEYGVMAALADRPGEAVSRAVLMEEVWGYSSSASSNVVETVVRSLRRKLGDQASRIKTVSGVGYMLR
jgi:DNA-binding response OmpR family regulator